MMILYAWTAWAQTYRLEATVTPQSGSPVVVDLDSYDLSGSNVGVVTGPGGGAARITYDPVVLRRVADSSSQGLLTFAQSAEQYIVTLRAYSGTRVVQQVVLEPAVSSGYRTVLREDALNLEVLEFSPGCVEVTYNTYDANLMPTGTFVHAWSVLDNTPGCGT